MMQQRQQAIRRRNGGFTLVEALVAVAVLAMVTLMVFRSLISVLDATRIGAVAADRVQRERVAMKAVEDGLRGMVYYQQNQLMYALTTDITDPDQPYFSFVSRVPPDYIGSREFAGQTLRRLAFSVIYTNNSRALVLEQSHVMRPPDGTEDAPVVRSVLAPELDEFIVLFWSTSAEDWIDEWEDTNSLPSRVKVEMALERTDGGEMQLTDILKREVVIHSMAITKNQQNPEAAPAAAGGRPQGGRPQGSRPKYTPEQIAAYRKRQAEQRARNGNDGRSRYTDKQREEYRKRMQERYGGQRANSLPRNNQPGNTQSSGGQSSGGQSSGGPVNNQSTPASTPGVTDINDALMDYQALNGVPATSIQQLLEEGYLNSIPDPPAGYQWAINYQGNVTTIPL